MPDLYRLFLSSILTRGRVIGLAALGAVAVLIGFAIGASDTASELRDGTDMVAGMGLSLVAPVVALVFASAVLGDPNEDGTLVYLWLRPVPRWQLALSSVAAALSLTMPVVVVPMALAAALTGAGSALIGAAVASCTLACVAYCAIFTWLGLRVKRAMAWGLAYVLVWEGFVARAGSGAALFSVRSHTQSLLSLLADGPRRLVESTMTEAILIPLAAAAVAAWLTVRRLQTQDVA